MADIKEYVTQSLIAVTASAFVFLTTEMQAQLLVGGPQTNFMHKKQTEEVRLLKQVVQRLCTKLKDYQKQFNSNKSLLASE